jgi:hypothetical protein
VTHQRAPLAQFCSRFAAASARAACFAPAGSGGHSLPAALSPRLGATAPIMADRARGAAGTLSASQQLSASQHLTPRASAGSPGFARRSLRCEWFGHAAQAELRSGWREAALRGVLRLVYPSCSDIKAWSGWLRRSTAASTLVDTWTLLPLLLKLFAHRNVFFVGTVQTRRPERCFVYLAVCKFMVIVYCPFRRDPACGSNLY